MNMQEIKDIIISDNEDLVKKLEKAGGFGAKHLAIATNILEKMNKEKCIKFFSFPSCLVATGLRGVISEMIQKGLVDIIITTAGTLVHDLVRAWGGKYYHGSFELDDKDLHKRGINRLGNILVPNESYVEVLEKNMIPILEELYKIKKEWSPRELTYEFGKGINDNNSILYQAAKKNIPIYVPGIVDGAFGTQLTWFSQDHDFELDLLKDEKELAEYGFSKQKTGALMIGGGISKHHVIWWNQFRGGLDYAVYITTANQYDGSLSGARLKEAVSWGKIKEDARYITVDGDATIILPLILSSLYKRI